MKIATFNVNSIRRRLPLVLDWLSQHQPDVMCLQETKTPDQEFPAEHGRSRHGQRDHAQGHQEGCERGSPLREERVPAMQTTRQ